LEADMRPYQVTGFKWLKSLDHYGFGGVLADDMGLGKTIQTIAFLQSKIESEKGKYLIICPSSVLFNWRHEWDKFVPDTDTIIISGSKEEREQKRQEAIDKDIPIWITSYPLIQRDFDLYKEDTFKTIILDESQNVKNSAAKTTKAVKRLTSETKIALSGTPIENHLGELWSLFSIIQPGLFRNKKAFQSMEQERIAAKIKPFILRRLKRDVLDDLPEKTETTEYIELSEGQKRLYQTQRAAIKQELKELVDSDTLKTNRIKVLAGMTRLRQICCDPKLIMPDYEGESSKLERLMEYLKEARANGKRVVLFSQFTSMLKIIRERLDDIDVDYHYLDGQTKNEERLNLTTRFNTGEKDLFLISLKAGGTGLNLTGGDTVILFDSWWNPAIEDQAADRVHRFGQKKSVQIIRFITTGTIEERINDLQDKKRELVDSVITKGNKESVTSLSTEEILELLYED
ncbi:MAG: DEAD/DEAH box helicase, partial [Alkalibacterium sp.]